MHRYAPLALFLSLGLPAQANLVVNGDFDQGNTNGWTFGGYTLGAQVSSFDTTGVGATSGSLTPTSHIDNIRVVMEPGPDICPRGERQLGQNLDLEVLGAANGRFNLYVALSGLAQPVAIPGFLGAWQLGPPALTVATGNFDAKGVFRQSFPIPNLPSLGGVPLFWQGIQLSGSSVTMGPIAMLGVY